MNFIQSDILNHLFSHKAKLGPSHFSGKFKGLMNFPTKNLAKAFDWDLLQVGEKGKPESSGDEKRKGRDAEGQKIFPSS